MIYAIQVNSGPGASSAPCIAYRFIEAALERGHTVARVFFYRDGVGHAFARCADAGNPESSRPDWAGLARRNKLELTFCTAAAERRGLYLTDQPEPVAPACVDGFSPGGLAAWVDACLKADRVLVFA
ncbi:MAG: sulfurtransferase complex subunit TusD [Methylococcus sp.]|nr:MAG: sulfurtransferase complex subunit TusD [Methylococcus sp.]